MTPRLRSRTTALALVFAVLVSACVGDPAAPAPEQPAVPGGGELRVGIESDPGSLDPGHATDTSSALVTRQVFETLVDIDSGFAVVPRLATRFERSADGRTWTFTLRPGVRFHDGSPFDATAVAANLSRARDFARYRELLEPGGIALVTGIAITDERTVIVTLRGSFGPFLAVLALPTFAMVSPRSLTEDPAGWMLPGSRSAAGTGPFELRPGAWQRGRQISLERSAIYWDRDAQRRALPYLDRVTFRVVPDAATRLAELRSGALDVLPELPAHDASAIAGNPNQVLLPRPPSGIVSLGVESAVRPFDRPEVRRALALAIDRAAIAQSAQGGEGKAAAQLVPPGMLGYDDSVTEFQRLDEGTARRLLGDAGHPRGFDTVLWLAPVDGDPEPRRVAEAIAADLLRVGIRVQLRVTDPVSLARDAQAHRLPLFLAEQRSRTGDPDELFSALFAPEATDGTGWSNPQVTALLRYARAEPNEARRAELYKQVSKIVQVEVPRIPLFHPRRPLAITKKVRGVVPQAIGSESFGRVSLGR